MLCCNKTVRQAADYVTKQGLHFLDTIHACNIKPWRKIEFLLWGENAKLGSLFKLLEETLFYIIITLDVEIFQSLYFFEDTHYLNSLLYYKVCIQIGIL